MNLRDKVLEAFKILRRRGVVCRANFACCGGCASSEIASYMEKSPNKIGAAFWHRQTEQCYQEAKDGQGRLLIYFGAKENWATKTTLADRWIGYAITDALQEVGLHPDWNGDVDLAIAVDESREKSNEYPWPQILGNAV